MDAFAAEQGQRDGERGVRRRNGAGDADQADLEGVIEREAGHCVEEASDGGEGPRRPTGRDGVRKPTSEPQIEAEGREAEKLHEHQRAECADAARGETGGEIRYTPAECRRYSEEDFQMDFSKRRATDAADAEERFFDFVRRGGLPSE